MVPTDGRWSRRSLLIGGGALTVTLLGPRFNVLASSRQDVVAEYAEPDWLVDSAWLSEELAAGAVKVVALTPPDQFEAGHIPGAAQIDWADLAVTDTSEPSISAWQADVEAILTRLGLSPSDRIVLYDGGTLLAGRLWWILDLLGHAETRMLNGGFPAWQAFGGEIETGASTVEPAAEAYAGAPDHSKLATLEEVAALIDDPAVVLVDARNADEFAAGHIPGAVNHPFPLNAAADPPKLWKSAGELLDDYAALGVTPEKEVIAYCATGVRSSVTYFTLRMIGFPAVRVYTGSWNEWITHEDLPTATGE